MNVETAQRYVEEATLHGGPWLASDGWVTKYIDMLACFAAHPFEWAEYYRERLLDVDTVVVCGRSGAWLGGMLSFYYGLNIVVSNGGKGYGLPFNGRWGQEKRAALVDDICVTGTTLDNLRGWVLVHGGHVVREVVAWPVLDVQETVAKRLKQV